MTDPPDTFDGTIEELKRTALAMAAETGVPVEDTVEWEAVELLEHWRAALQTVADGCDDPASVAREALNWLVYAGFIAGSTE